MKCWECNNEGVKQFDVKKMEYFLDEPMGLETVSKRWYCEECFERIAEERKKDRLEYVRLKKKLMYERAVRMFERQDAELYDYKEALDAVRKYSEKNPDRFDSAHEMLAAAMLIHGGQSIKMQHRVAGYRVDFFIPKLKVVLEVDGEFHKHSKKRDSKRDIEIRNELGKEFEIVRIDTKFLEENAKCLVKAVKEIRQERQKVRSKNFGLLPEWYKT